ncbi:MAG: SAM-dependent DNA methyltransferase [Opitutae bacterium]|nr:SAM-dependent DNA methyltransferase [Opitutae bacterium]
MKTFGKVEFGDFQTPLALARAVCGTLHRLGLRADNILEPTCGEGSLLLAAAEFFPDTKLFGFEINEQHLAAAGARLASAGHSPRTRLQTADFFTHDWEAELASLDNLLVIGNPPWVTQAAVGGLAGRNLPKKSNLDGLRGLAAKTGKANFDIAEWILIRLLRALRGRPATVAVLCKTATARKVLRHAWRNDLRVASASLYAVDAAAHFGVAVEACLFILRLGHNGREEADLYRDLEAVAPWRQIGLAGQDLVSDLTAYRLQSKYEGVHPYQWRSGVKHDCASVLELTRCGANRYRNKLGQETELETEVVYPWFKGTDLKNDAVATRFSLLLPQTYPGEDTAVRFRDAPLALRYLQQHQPAFAARKSSIYLRRDRFAIFGVGDYSFAAWKVALSALHRQPRFVAVGPEAGRPVLFDDTCYFIAMSSQQEATVVAQILNSQPCQDFLSTLTFPGAKRTVTVDLLQRLNLSALARVVGLEKAWLESRRQHPMAQLELAVSEP